MPKSITFVLVQAMSRADMSIRTEVIEIKPQKFG